MPGILFVCTGNLYRSPLAAAFFRAKLLADGRNDWTVDSAGTWTQPGQPVSPETIRAAAKFGANLEGHLSQLISADLLSRFDLALVMEQGHKEALDQEFPFASRKTHLISQVVDCLVYDIPDPLSSGQELDILASDLFKLVERGYQTICGLAQDAAVSKPTLGDPS
jgi:protein-tyrosine phosphatase